jgi:guanylate kinase
MMATRISSKRKGNLVILSGPSGVGKTTLRRRVQQKIDSLSFSISWTTRPPRPGEKPDQDYHFVAPARFEQQITRGGFLEWARVHNDYYGTPLPPVRTWLRQGRDVLLDIDVQGARQVKQKMPEAVSVFILPPSRQELKRRLSRRRTESPQALRLRLRNAEQEMADWVLFDYAVINAEIQASLKALLSIIQAQHYRVSGP